MNRAGSLLERVVVFVVGAALLVLGVAAAAWWLGWIPNAISRVDASRPLEWSRTDWWPWAVGGAGLALIVMGLAWLSAHTRRATLRRVRLPGASGKGRLSVDGSTLTGAALAELEATPGVRRPRTGRAVRERKHLVVELRAGLDPGAELDEVADGAQRAAAVLGRHLGPNTSARCRVVFTRAGGKAKVSRVR